jgi:F-type H+-transporting ATPase subunit delta
MRARQSTARRYAKALYMAARESAATEPVGREIEGFAGLFASEPAVREVLGRPWIKAGDRRAAAQAIAERGGCGTTVQNFVGLLAERRRLHHLEEVVHAYRMLVDDEQGRARAQVRTAVPLTDAEKQQLATRLGQALGKRIILEERVDSTLLGGFVAQVGSLILDGSLDGQLERLRERLARGSA